MSVEQSVISITAFEGLSPKTSDANARNGVAGKLVNCFVRGGRLQPMRSNRLIKSVSGQANNGFVLRPSDEETILTPLPTHQIQWRDDRIIFTDGAGGTKQVSGVSGAAMTASDLRFTPDKASGGEPALTATASGGTTPQVRTQFAATFVNTHGDESDPIFITNADGTGGILANTNATITLAVSNTNHAQAEGATHVQFYRQTQATGSLYVPIEGGRQPINGANLRWDVEPTALNLSFPTLFTSPRGSTAVPTSASGDDNDGGLKKIVQMPGDFLAGFSKNYVWFSEVGRPTVFPREYRVRVPGGDIIGMESLVDSLYVFAENAPPTIFTATQPTNPQVNFSTVPWHCVSGDSVVNTGYGVWYASKSGIVALNGTRGELITKEIFDEETFASYITNEPSAVSADGIYYLLSSGKTLVIDTQGFGGIQCCEMSEAFSDAKHANGSVYAVGGNCVCELGGGDEYAEGEWQSKILKYVNPELPAAAQVFGDFGEQIYSVNIGGIGSTNFGAEALGDESFETTSREELGEISVTIETGEGVALDAMTFRDGAAKSSGAGRRFRDELCVRVRTKIGVRAVSIAPNKEMLRGAV